MRDMTHAEEITYLHRIVVRALDTEKQTETMRLGHAHLPGNGKPLKTCWDLIEAAFPLHGNHAHLVVV